MWLHQNKLNSANAQKWHLTKNIQLVSVLIVIIVSFTSAAFQYPLEKNQLVLNDNNTLLSSEFLPECSAPNAEIPLCAMYYDTVYNVYKYGRKGVEVKAAMEEADNKFENQELINQFCSLLVNDSAIALEAQPFSKKNNLNITQWIRANYRCQVNCLYDTPEVSNSVRVKKVCKYILGGCRWIAAQKKNFVPTDAQPLAVNPKPNLNPNQIPLPNEEAKADVKPDEKKETNKNEANNENQNQVQSPNSSINVNASPQKPAKSSTKPSQAMIAPKVGEELPQPAAIPPNALSSVTPKLNKTTNDKPTKADTNPSQTNANPAPAKPIEAVQTIKVSPPSPPSEDDDAYNAEQRNDLENDQKPIGNDDDPENEHDDAEEDSGDEFPDIKSNNIAQGVQSVQNVQKDQLLQAEVPDFREDKESSFFPYFMFLMFVVVSFYVAYHNKSKILALLIEGRRSRSYSSRGGGRRKQHSAEYRKLDSNLEEAIQSDGGHVLSTQIIY